MKKSPLFILILSILVLSLAGLAHGWQGRMGGMGDPYGLIADESDFLIHPSGIAKGEGIKFYGSYRFNYQDVGKWDYSINMYSMTGIFMIGWPFRGSGDEWIHDALIGATFPVGVGRMGLLFQYAGRRGDYDGKENQSSGSGPTLYHKYSLDDNFDAFTLRLLYGIPINNLKLGGEIELAYHKEENQTSIMRFIPGPIFFINEYHQNYPFGANNYNLDLFPFMIPYDSNYWEALFKGSIEGGVGALKINFTARGGFLFGGGNKLEYRGYIAPNSGGVDMDGGVKGWSVGSDLWVKYLLAKDLSLPFLLKIGYQKKSRDGDGIAFGALTGNFDYKNEEKVFQLQAGGGIHKEIGSGMRIAAGVYYGFNNHEMSYILTNPNIFDHTKFPNHTEHQILLKLSAEKEISPMVALRMGLNFFYGWVNEDFKFIYNNLPWGIQKISLDGYQWGIGASFGATIKFRPIILEPFLGGGYRRLDLDGNGIDTFSPTLLEMDKLRKEWSIGGGFSIKFN